MEARLLLGQDAKPKKREKIRGPEMSFDVFRDQYRMLHLSTIRSRSASCAESRLDVAERIMSPKTLGDLATGEALHELQAKLVAGEGVSDRDRKAREKKGEPIIQPRSKHTAKSYMAVILGALNWAHLQGWLESVPPVRKVKVSKLKAMKGRPIVLEEFERMLKVTPDVVGDNEGNPTGEYRYNGTVANKSLELLGKHLGMFNDNYQVEHKLDVNFFADILQGVERNRHNNVIDAEYIEQFIDDRNNL